MEPECWKGKIDDEKYDSHWQHCEVFGLFSRPLNFLRGETTCHNGMLFQWFSVYISDRSLRKFKCVSLGHSVCGRARESIWRGLCQWWLLSMLQPDWPSAKCHKVWKALDTEVSVTRCWSIIPQAQDLKQQDPVWSGCHFSCLGGFKPIWSQSPWNVQDAASQFWLERSREVPWPDGPVQEAQDATAFPDCNRERVLLSGRGQYWAKEL